MPSSPRPMLGQQYLVSAKRRASWSEVDTRCVPRALHLLPPRCHEQTRELYGRLRLARDMRRRHSGRPPGRWEDALVAAWGQGWADERQDHGAIVHRCRGQRVGRWTKMLCPTSAVSACSAPSVFSPPEVWTPGTLSPNGLSLAGHPSQST